MMLRHKRQNWKPQPSGLHKRKTEDAHLLKMLEGCRPAIETQLPEHILRYRLQRLKHPNFLPKPITIVDRKIMMDAHDHMVATARGGTVHHMNPRMLQRMKEQHAKRYTKSGQLKIEFQRRKPKKLSKHETYQAEMMWLQHASEVH